MTATRDDPDAVGTVLVRSRFRPRYAVAILVAGMVQVLLALDGLYRGYVMPAGSGSMSRGALGVLLVLGALAAAFGAWQLLRPTVFVEATDRGLVLYRLPGAPAARDAPRCLLVPWTRIRGLDYEVHALPTGIRRARVRTIAVRLVTDDGGFSVPEGFNLFLKPVPGSDPAALYIDAGSGSPGGRELLRRLEELRVGSGDPGP